MASSPPIRGVRNADPLAFLEGDLENAVPPGCAPTRPANKAAPAKKVGAKAVAAVAPQGSPKIGGGLGGSPKNSAVSSPKVSSPAIRGAAGSSAARPASSPALRPASSPAVRPASSPAIAAQASASGSSSSPAAPARTGAAFYEKMLDEGADPFGSSSGPSAASNKPLEARVTDKNWKIRKEAYEEVLAAIQAASPNESADWASSVAAMVKDSNAAAQEKGSEVLTALLSKWPAAGAGPAAEVASILVEKGLTGRPAFKASATETLNLMVECETAQEACIEALISGTAHKVPKTAAAAARLLFDIFKAFGAKVVSPKPLLKVLPAMFDHGDAGVRSAAQDLALEIYRWIRAAIKQSLKDIKPVQLKELDDLFAKEDAAGTGKPRPTRFTRAEQARIAANPEAAQAEMDAAARGKGPGDDDDIMGPTEVLSKLKAPWYAALESSKWQDRKESISTLISLADVPGKIAQGDFGDVFRALRKIVKDDSNINVVALAVGAIGILARGLGSSFNTYSRSMVPILLDKFKDKNKSVVTACHTAIGHMMRSLALADLLEDFNAAAQHKVPKVKVEAFLLLATVFDEKIVSDKDAKKCLKELAPILVSKGIADGVVEVRDAATKAVTALANSVGAVVLAPFLTDIEPSRLASVLGGASAAGPVAKAGPAPAASSTTSAPASAAAPAAPSVKAGAAPAKTGAAPSGKRPTTAGPSSSSASAAGASSSSSAAAAGSEDLSPSMGSEAAVEKIETLVGEAAVKALRSANWKERLDCFDAFTTAFAEAQACDDFSEALVLGVEKITGGKEGNFQVNRRMVDLYTHVVRTATVVPKRVVAQLVPVLLGKIHEVKTRENSRVCMTACAEVTQPALLAGILAKEAQAAKNPKVVIEILSWLREAIVDFGTASFVSQIKAIIDLVRNSLDHSNAAVRSEALGVLTSLASNAKLIASVKTKLSDLKPALLGNIEDAIAKAPKEEAPPTKFARGDVKRVTASAGGGGGGGGSTAAGADVDLLDELSPRVDISSKITPELLAQLSETGRDNWKSKLEALEALTKVLNDANNRIQPKLGELVTPLKKLLSDVNKNIVAQAATLVGQLAVALGPACEKLAKYFVGTLMSCFCDNKSNVRTAVSAALDAWVTQITIAPVFLHAATILSGPNPTARLETLTWLATHDADIKAVDGRSQGKDLAEIFKPAVSCLQDRTPDIRNAADAVLAAVLAATGSNMLSKEAKTYSQGDKLAVDVFLKKHPEIGATGASKPSAGAGASSAPGSSAAAVVEPASKRSATSAPGTPSGKPSSSAAQSKPRTPTASAGQAKSRTAGAPGAAAASAPAASTAAAAAAAAASTAASLFKRNGLKDKRQAKNEKGLRWAFEEPEAKYVDLCREQAASCFSEELTESLFSDDFRNHISALESLMTELPGDAAFAVEAADVLFKWVSLRLCEGNIRVLLKSLEFVRVVFDTLVARAYIISDYEASCLLPFLVDRVGHNNDVLRKSMRDLLREARKIYPSTKLFAAIYDGLKSKNSRSRVECLEEMGSLIGAQGLAATGSPFKVLPVIASYVNDRDVHVRNAAMGALAEVNAIAPVDFWKYLAGVDEKVKEKLEEKFRGGAAAAGATAATSASAAAASATIAAGASSSHPSSSSAAGAAASGKAGAGKPSAAAQPAAPELSKGELDTVRREFGLKMDHIEAEIVSRDHAADAAATFAARSAVPQASVLSDPTPMPQSKTLSRLAILHGQDAPPAVAPAAGAAPAAAPPAASVAAAAAQAAPPRSWRLVLRSAVSGTADTELVHLREFTNFLSSSGTELGAEADALASHLSTLLHDAFAQKREAFFLGGLKAMTMLFAHPTGIGRTVSVGVLVGVIRGLGGSMVSPLLSGLPNATAVLAEMNSTTLAVLEHSDRNVAFAATLNLLRSELTSAPRGAPTPKIVDLVVKVLHKMIKALPRTIDILDVDALLLDIHIYFREHPPHRNRDTAHLSVVKTLLNELVTLMGPRIRQHYTKIPAGEATPAVVSYIELMLNPGSASQPPSAKKSPTHSHTAPSVIPAPAPSQAVAAPAVAPPAVARAAGAASVAGAEVPAPPVASAPASASSLDAELETIFARLRNVGTSKDALKELYDFSKAHPDLDLHARTASMTSGFQQYIFRGLEAIDRAPAAAAAAAAPVSATAAAPVTVASSSALPTAGTDRLMDIRSKMEAVKQRSAALQQQQPAGGLRTASAPLQAQVQAQVQAQAQALPQAQPQAQGFSQPPAQVQQVQQPVTMVGGGWQQQQQQSPLRHMSQPFAAASPQLVRLPVPVSTASPLHHMPQPAPQPVQGSTAADFRARLARTTGVATASVPAAQQQQLQQHPQSPHRIIAQQQQQPLFAHASPVASPHHPRFHGQVRYL